MKRFFHISIVWVKGEKSMEQLRPIYDLADDWIFYGYSNWIIYTSEDAFTWQGRIKAVISLEDSFFICEIANVKNSGGWLPKLVWEWIKMERETNLLSPISSPTLLGFLDPPKR